jgi:tight adherence protein B
MSPALIFLLLLVMSVPALGAGAWLVLAPDRGFARRLQRAARAEKDQDKEQSDLGKLLDRRAPWLRRKLLAAGAPFAPEHVALGAAGLTGGFLLLGAIAGLPMLLVLALAIWGGLAGPYLLIGWMGARRRKLFLAQMPQAVDLIARSLQAGHPVTTAMSVAARQMPDPVGPEFTKVIAEMRHGLDRDAAMRNLLLRFPLAELRMFVASMEVTRETGGNLSEVLLKLSETIRSKAQLRKRVLAISAEGRLTFWVVSVLPIATAGAITLLSPNYYRAVASDPLFLPLMSGPPVLWLIGTVVLWRMVNFRI